MKSILTISVIFCSIYANAQNTEGGIRVLSAVDGFFHFKISPNLKEARVEVYDESQKLISKQEINCRRMLIDFYDAEPGTYTIQIIAGVFRKTFQYTLLADEGYLKIANTSAPVTNLSYVRYRILAKK